MCKVREKPQLLVCHPQDAFMALGLQEMEDRIVLLLPSCHPCPRLEYPHLATLRDLPFQTFREHLSLTMALQSLPRKPAVSLLLIQRKGALTQGWRDNLLDLMKGSTRLHVKVIFKGIVASIFVLDSDFKTHSQVRYNAGNLSFSIPNCNFSWVRSIIL